MIKGFRTLVVLAVVGILLLIGGGIALSWKLPSVSALKNFRPALASEVFSEDYVKIGEFYREKRKFVPLHQIPPLLIQAFIAAEDSQFFEHKGVSFTGILRATLKNVLAGEVKQGGSTITQQVAKGLLLTPERSVTRKIREAVLAFKMEKFLTKEEILEIYLNQVYLGHSSYGVAAAAESYFGKDLTNLSIAEMAMIAGLTRAPSRDNPFESRERAREKQVYVLNRMQEEKYISSEDLASASSAPLELNRQPNVNLMYAPYFVEHVRRYVKEKYGDDNILEGGLQIYTTVNAKGARASQEAVRVGIEELDRHGGYRGPITHLKDVERPAFLQKLQKQVGTEPLQKDVNYQALVTAVSDKEGWVFVSLGTQSGAIPFETMQWARKPNPERFWENDLIKKPSEALKVGDVILVRLSPPDEKLGKNPPRDSVLVHLAQEPLVQGALVAMSPVTGAIHAMVGGYDFERSEFNRAVQALRQPGSSFKPIIYSAALDHGYTAASTIVDSPISYDDPTTEFKWRPKNYGGKFYGDTIFRDCLIESRNIPTVKIVQDIGIDAVIDRARQMGITATLARDYSLALGSSALAPIELVAAYTTFATGGRRASPVFIRKIVDRDGNVLERNLLDDPALDLLEQAAVGQQQLALGRDHALAVTLGKEKKPLPAGYVMSPQTAYIMTHLMKQVVKFGTGHRAAALDRPVAGKTGTTNDNHDAWFVGFTPNMVAGVWLGFDESQQTLGAMEEGGRVAAPIWVNYMRAALEGLPILDFPVPEGVIFAQIDAKTGKLATGKTKNPVFEAFFEGTDPKETTDEAQAKKSPQQFFLQE